MRALAFLVLVFLIPGCANVNSIWRNRTVINDATYISKIVSVDAKQRVIISTRNNGGIMTCAEFAPDIFTVHSSGFSVDGDYGASTPNKNISLGIAQAMSEAGANIRRTQTVNLLAMSLYRTCERYLNGVIDKSEFISQARRDHQLMISTLAIEQITAFLQPPAPIVLLTGQTASKGESAVEILAEAKKSLTTANEGLTKAQDKYNSAVAEAPDSASDKECDSITEAEKKESCNSAKKELATAATAKEEAEKYYQAILNSAGSESKSVSASFNAQVISQTLQTKNVDANNSEFYKKILDTVKEIAAMGMKVDRADETCAFIIRMNSRDNPDQKAMLANCFDKLAEDVGESINQDNTKAEQVKQTSKKKPLRVFIQVSNDITKKTGEKINTILGSDSAYKIFSIETVRDFPASNEIRFFHPEDLNDAKKIQADITNVLPKVDVVKVPGYESRVPRGQMEIWISK